MSLANYKSLNATAGATMTSSLNELCAQEAESVAHGPIQLSSAADIDAPGPNMTPGMRQWISAHIASTRRLAWGEIAAKARSIQVKNIDGIVLEIEEDRIERTKQQKTAEMVEQFTRQHKPLIQKVEVLSRELEDMRQAEGGRDPKIPSRWLEWGLLLPIIMIPESMMNYASFRGMPLVSSAFMAVGLTLIVGYALAWAAHLLGLFIRRYRYYLHPEDQQRRHSGLSTLTIGLVLLLISIGAVAVARYYFLLPLIADAKLTGASLPSLPVSIGSLLLGNLIAVVLGIAVTFYLHDPNERFYDTGKNLRKDRAELDRVRGRELTRRIDAAEQTAKQDLQQAQNRNHQMSGASGYGDLQTQISQLQSVDAAVLGQLERYRAGLAKAIQARNPSFRFRQFMPALDRGEATRDVDVSEFLNMNLRLWRQS